MSGFHRLPNWEANLSRYLEQVADDQFRWGSHDCSLFAASAVFAQTGVDPGKAFRGQYSDREGAALALREHGAGTLLKTMKATFGAPKSVHLAQRGDIVMRDRANAGVCVGQFSWFVGSEQGREGLVVMPTRECRYAFTVPFEAEGR